MSETFMKERPILPLLASMALPMVLEELAEEDPGDRDGEAKTLDRRTEP